MADSNSQDLRHTIIQNVPPAMVLAILAVVARFVSRRLKRGGIVWHDIFIVLGLLGSLLQSALVIVAASEGIGLHLWQVSDANIRIIFILEFVAKIDYALTFTFVKVSILLLYRSIFQGRGFAIATHIIMGYVIAWGVAVLVVSIFSCTPVNGFWDVNIPSTCVSSIQFFAWTTITNILGDVLILALPVRRVSRLKMNTKQKVAVTSMFLLGGFVVLAKVIRLIYMVKMDVTDATWTYVQPAIWFTVELNVAVISACLPTLRPLIQRLWPAALASSVASFLSRSTNGRSRANSKGGASSKKNSGQSSNVGKVSQNSDMTVLTDSNVVEFDYAAEKRLSSLGHTVVSPLTSPMRPSEQMPSPTITITTDNSSSATRHIFPSAAIGPTPETHCRKSSASSAKSILSRLRRPSTSSRAATEPEPEPPIPTLTITRPTPTPSTFILTPSSIASVPMMPLSIPTLPAPGCFQPEDAERRLSRGRIASWHNYAISNAGITETGQLGLDFERDARWRRSRYEGEESGAWSEEALEEGDGSEEPEEPEERRDVATMWNVSEGEESRSQSSDRSRSPSPPSDRSWNSNYYQDGIGVALGGYEDEEYRPIHRAPQGRWI